MSVVIMVVLLIMLALVVVVLWAVDHNTKHVVTTLWKENELALKQHNHLIQRIEHSLAQFEQFNQRADQNFTTTNELIEKLSRLVEDTTLDVNLQLRDLNKLTKSDLNTARQNELLRTKELKAAIDRVIATATLTRQDPAAQDVMALRAVEQRIQELEDILGGE